MIWKTTAEMPSNLSPSTRFVRVRSHTQTHAAGDGRDGNLDSGRERASAAPPTAATTQRLSRWRTVGGWKGSQQLLARAFLLSTAQAFWPVVLST